MSALKLTPWFPAGTVPTRTGAYLTNGSPFTSSDSYQYWTGVFWGGWGSDPKTAESNRFFKSISQRVEWRGLAEKP